jgi:hypothetical protein
VLEESRTTLSSNGQDYQLEVKSRWLLGDKVNEKFLADPRKDDAFPMEEFIDFVPKK